MSTLVVNLKHLYQRRALWLVYVLLGCAATGVVAAPLHRPQAGNGLYVGPLMVAFMVGFLATILQIEVLAKPFSYCLPGHRRIVRKWVFPIGVATNALCSMLFLTYPDLSGPQLVLVLCSAFFAGVVFYLVGAAAALGVRNAAIVFGLLPAAIVAEGLFDLHVLLERIIVAQPHLPISVGILSSVVMWFWLGRPGLARRYCAVPWLGFMDFFNQEKLRRYTSARAGSWQRRFSKHPRPWVENWFLGRMDRHDYRGPGRFFWGALYCTSAMAVSQWQTFLLFIPALTIMFGYIGQAVVFALIMVPAIFAMGRQPPVYSTMLISGGRHRRCTTTLWLTVTDTALLCIGTLVVSGLSILLARFMPIFTVEGKSFSFQPIDPRVAIVPLIFLPFASTMQLVFHTRPILILTSLLLPLYMVMALGTIWREHLDFLVNPLSIVSLLVVGWGVFLLTLRHICEKWCLVGQRRMH